MFDRQFNLVKLLKANMASIDDAFLVGSAARSANPSDIDIMLVSSEKNRDSELYNIMNILNALGYESGCQLMDDAVRISLPSTIDLSLAVFSKETLEETVSGMYYGDVKIMTPSHRPWTAGYWMPETFAADLLAARPVFQDDYLQRLQSYFLTYPKAMKDAIIKMCDTEIALKENKTLTCADAWMSGSLKGEIGFAQIRKAFAEDEIYLRSFRNVEQQALQGGKDRLVNNVRSIISSLEVSKLQ